jgi:hypothetical protein
MTVISVVNYFGPVLQPPHVYHTISCTFLSVYTTSHLRWQELSVLDWRVQHHHMSYLYRLASASDASGDTSTRGASIVLPQLSTVSTQAACMRVEDVVCTLPALEIGGQASLAKRARWRAWRKKDILAQSDSTQMYHSVCTRPENSKKDPR